MMKTILHRSSPYKSLRAILLALLLVAAPFLVNSNANAAVITSRSVTLSSSVGDATNVSYTFNSAALPTTGTAIQSVEMQLCTTATGACSTPSGFLNNTSTLLSQPTGLGAGTGWTVNTAGTGALRIVNAANVTNPSGAVSIAWGSVHNPTATNSTFFARITTYSGNNWSTGPLDTGTMALSTSALIQVTLAVDETLTFCTGTSITGQNCGSVAGTVVGLGTGSTTVAQTGTSVMAASTNGTGGYTITVQGTTLTSGANTIVQAGTTPVASAVGTSQYGFNLAVAGPGTGTVNANFSNASLYRFNSSLVDTVGSASGPTNGNTFTVNYIANIAGTTLPGAYTSDLIYTATANF